jgi:hypothetical protein
MNVRKSPDFHCLMKIKTGSTFLHKYQFNEIIATSNCVIYAVFPNEPKVQLSKRVIKRCFYARDNEASS